MYSLIMQTQWDCICGNNAVGLIMGIKKITFQSAWLGSSTPVSGGRPKTKDVESFLPLPQVYWRSKPLFSLQVQNVPFSQQFGSQIILGGLHSVHWGGEGQTIILRGCNIFWRFYNFIGI